MEKNEYLPEIYFRKGNRVFNAFYCDEEGFIPNPRDNEACFCSFLTGSRGRYLVGANNPEEMDALDEKDSRVDAEDFDLKEFKKKCFVYKPLYLHDHSSQSLHTYPIDRWDSSHVGYAYVTGNNKELKEYLKDHSEEDAKKYAETLIDNDVEKYSKFLSGEVYCVCFKEYDFEENIWVDVCEPNYPSYCGGYYFLGKTYKEEQKEALVELKSFLGKEELDNIFEKKDLNKVIEECRLSRKQEYIDRCTSEIDSLLKELGCSANEENKLKVKKTMKSLGMDM